MERQSLLVTTPTAMRLQSFKLIWLGSKILWLLRCWISNMRVILFTFYILVPYIKYLFTKFPSIWFFFWQRSPPTASIVIFCLQLSNTVPKLGGSHHPILKLTILVVFYRLLGIRGLLACSIIQSCCVACVQQS